MLSMYQRPDRGKNTFFVLKIALNDRFRKNQIDSKTSVDTPAVCKHESYEHLTGKLSSVYNIYIKVKLHFKRSLSKAS